MAKGKEREGEGGRGPTRRRRGLRRRRGRRGERGRSGKGDEESAKERPERVAMDIVLEFQVPLKTQVIARIIRNELP